MTKQRHRRPATLEEAERQGQYAARAMKKIMPRGWGFLLVMAQFGPDGDLTYVSDINREDAVAMLLELFGKWEVEAETGKDHPDRKLSERETISPAISEVVEVLALLASLISSPGITVGINELALELAGVDPRFPNSPEAKRIAEKTEEGLRDVLKAANRVVSKWAPGILEDGEP